MRTAAIFVLGLIPFANTNSDSPGCSISISECNAHPHMTNLNFRDTDGEVHAQTANVEAACHIRAADYHRFCRNEAPSVSASFHASGTSFMFNPDACDAGWLSWNGACYLYVDQLVTFHQADAYCRSQDASLASIHSDAENALASDLSKGRSCWIGYVDIRKLDTEPENFTWTDNSQNDYNNWAADCQGREDHPDCTPESKQQQWFDWNDGNDPAPFICKKSAKVASSIAVAVAAGALKQPLAVVEPDLKLNTLPVRTTSNVFGN